MEYKNLHRAIAAAVFIVSAFVYLLTVQSNVSFWDCGEFIASAFLLQVPHPPGTPFFLLLGRLSSMLPIGDNVAFRVNLVSVFASAFIVLFLYLTAVKLIEFYKGNKHDSKLDALGTYLAAAIGALSLAFSDTFWFNAVEAEVYATATFFIGIVTWLMVTWHAKADDRDNEKYILFIAYLIGVSTGVHLMSVLAIVSIVMVIMFKKYLNDEETLKQTGYIFLGHVAIILVVGVVMWAGLDSSTPPSPEAAKETDFRFLTIFVLISIVYMGIFWKKIFRPNSFYLPMIFGGIALIVTYPGIVKYLPNFVSSVGKNNIVLDILIIAVLLAVLGYLIYWSNKTNKQTTHLVFKSILFAFLGFSSYAMIIIRANQDPPINLNSPKTFSEVVSYLNREQYGEAPIFQRRYTQEGHQMGVYRNYSSDLDFLWSYQMNHMFNRYLFWNYIGKPSTVQDSGVDWSKFWGIPFLIGLLGIYFHFQKDWKMAAVFLVMFIFLGYLTAFYQNQQQPQPRERDYFYVGAFFVYSIWIAIGVRGLLDLTKEYIKPAKSKELVFSAIIIATFLLIPINMLGTNFHINDRSRNYVPWDYSYNMLQSVAPNAILFTNGDNDTFPLWYLQDVEGVRQDVRIANLSLLNTPWYIKQLKHNTPHGADKVPMTLTDEEIDRIGPQRWEPRVLSLDVPDSIISEFNVTDSLILATKKLSWMMENTVQFGDIKALRTQDIVSLNIILANQWERPIYFAVTTPDDSKLGLDDYLRMEGFAFRLVPEPRSESFYYVEPNILKEQLFNEPEGYSKDYQPGFKFRGLNDPTIFFDENHTRLSSNYRNSFIRLALHYLEVEKNYEMAVKTLDEMEVKIPRSKLPMDYRLLHDLGKIYRRAGGIDQYKNIVADLEEPMWRMIEENPMSFNDEYSPYFILITNYENLQMYSKALEVVNKLESVIGENPNVKGLKNKFESLAKQQIEKPDTSKN
jgi:hypothetical protein